MLSLTQITKIYKSGDDTVYALDNVSVEFRQNEFVSILGPSGGGKTTLLNIVGGLDRYTSGDLIINGKSTKQFTSKDWDTYRNHSIGFIFQSYNLIPHQTVLSNVELALTLSGVSKKERRERAIEALKKVGLGDQIKKKPNQMSGGQMQRVAIARALVNDPEILLADEPTGALDSATSLQIMELLKEIANDRLVIMVTHNPELAEKYSTRIIKLLDGKVTDDSDPYVSSDEEPKAVKEKKSKGKKKHTSMSFFTALSLSLKNLLTKKTRTILTSFAGSIGIIGISLILALSTGINAYIEKVEEDTLSSYPLSIEQSTIDLSGTIVDMMEDQANLEEHGLDKIYSNDIMSSMMKSTISSASQNNLASFKEFLDSGKTNIKDYTNDIKYLYSTPLNIYKSDIEDGILKVSPDNALDYIGMGTSSMGASSMGASSMSPMQMMSVWKELVGDNKLLSEQYDVLKGRLPKKYNEVVLIVNKNNEVSDFMLYSLGIKDPEELKNMFKEYNETGTVTFEPKRTEYTYDDLLSLSYKLLVNTDYFEKQGNIWVDKSKDDVYVAQKLEDAEEIKVVGILRPNSDALSDTESGSIGYTHALMTTLLDKVNDSEIVKAQLADPDTDVFTAMPFPSDEDITFKNMHELQAYLMALPQQQQMEAGAALSQMQQAGMSESAILSAFASSLNNAQSDATYDSRLAEMGYADPEKPSGIALYSKDFEAKDFIKDIINDYNESVKEESDQITYTDYIGLMMSSVTTIINAISYILIAFVAISLVVSSIMIGIITYISVLERTKEIGILRAIGASKKDISRVFNAETLIVGFVAGALGIGLTLLLIIPINFILQSVTEISAAAELPAMAGVILVAISMFLTFIAGLIPSRIAAKKDPVVALRTE
ncbi:MAG: ABC transporter ATP-binding protein/permease [Ruminococcaceae bacterium]|nr:ABC transporter ATP-binding protein/permease [Oscillospiraceae bacterium]